MQKLMHYSLVDIRLFVAVADAGNVSRGAAHCFLAPSSASLRIKQLEESLGTRLFVREARGVSLTRAGQVMLEHCRRCLAELEQMHANLAPYAEGVKSHVTLFANSTAIASYLPEDLSVFLRAYPAVRVSLEERLSHEIVAAVAEGRADIGVVTWSDEHPDVTFWPYHEDELVIVAPAATELGQDGKVRFVECLAHPIVSLASGTAIHTFIAGKAAALGYPIDGLRLIRGRIGPWQVASTSLLHAIRWILLIGMIAFSERHIRRQQRTGIARRCRALFVRRFLRMTGFA